MNTSLPCFNLPASCTSADLGFLNLESWALESEIQLKESGIPLTIGIQNLSSTDRESGIQGYYVLNYLTRGE